jgi:hypothetical protein
MVFGAEKKAPYVIGNIDGNVILADFGDRDHVLFLLMGAALAEIQCFEYSAAHVLSLIIVPRSDGRMDLALETILNTQFDARLSELIRNLRKYSKHTEYPDALEKGRKSRNFVVHSFLRKFGWPMMEDKEYVEAIAELQKCRKDISNADMTSAHILADQQLTDVIVVHFDPKAGMSEL